jgi:hypothetical protein
MPITFRDGFIDVGARKLTLTLDIEAADREAESNKLFDTIARLMHIPNPETVQFNELPAGYHVTYSGVSAGEGFPITHLGRIELNELNASKLFGSVNSTRPQED